MAGDPFRHQYITIHNRLISVGFILMMVTGVAFWMLHRPAGRPPAAAARDPLAWASHAFLNCGLVLRAVFEPLPELVQHGGPAAWRLRHSAGVSCIFFCAVAVWERVRLPGRG